MKMLLRIIFILVNIISTNVYAVEKTKEESNFTLLCIVEKAIGVNLIENKWGTINNTLPKYIVKGLSKLNKECMKRFGNEFDIYRNIIKFSTWLLS